MDYRGLSYVQLQALFMRRRLDPYELMEQYAKSRKTAMRQINRIEKSAIPFTSEKPEFKAPSTIRNTNELIHAMAELNEFRDSKRYSLPGRIEIRDKAIETLHKNKITFVTAENYREYALFMKWFFDNEKNKLYGSQDDRVEEFFREKWGNVKDYKTEAAKKAALTRFMNAWKES